MRYLRTDSLPIGDLQPYPGNARVHDDAALDESAAINGQYRSVVARVLPDGGFQLLAGHGTVAAFGRRGDGSVRVELVEADDTEARRIVLADNATSRNASYDERLLLDLLDAASRDGGLPGTGYDTDAYRALLGDAVDVGVGTVAEGGAAGAYPSLADRFMLPPFDVLDARQGWWQDRKRRWQSLGIRSELGRSARVNAGQDSLNVIAQRGRYSRDEEQGLLMRSANGRDPTYYAQKRQAEAAAGRELTQAEFEADHYRPSGSYESGTSIFDPVLCELAYRWFSGDGMTVLDPFAGGSVRGLVAGVLGRRYVGNDLRADQVAANGEQLAEFRARGWLADPDAVTWSVGDSVTWVETLAEASADLLFTCPPYLWLERYSDDPADLSNASAAEFERGYGTILAGAARALRPDRYAVLVVGDVRNTRGGLVDLRGMTIRAAEAAGLRYQSGAVLVTAVGSLAVRAARSFVATRVLGRTHQDVLVFVKGSAKAAAEACGPVDVTDAVTAAADAEDEAA